MIRSIPDARCIKLPLLPFVFVGVVAFDVHYGHWLDKHQRLINDTRSALNSHASDDELRVLVESLMSNFDELFRIKGTAAKSDIFHLLSGMWKTPAERCFMWLGGFRSSELLKVITTFKHPDTILSLFSCPNTSTLGLN